MPKTICVDRIEGNIAICETDTGDWMHIATAQLPAGVREGDILAQRDGHFVLDPVLTQQTRQKAAALQKKLMEKAR